MLNRSIKLFLLRHAEDVASQLGKFEDLRLTIHGESQATNIANYLKQDEFTAIYCSPMLRTMQTADIIAQNLGVQVNATELLKDRDVGRASGMTYKQVQKQYSHLFTQSTFSPFFKFPEGESNQDVYNRAQEFVNTYINKTGGTNEKFLIVSHSLTLNYIIYILQDIGFQEELLYLFEYGMGCIINKEYGRTIFRMIEFTDFAKKGENRGFSTNFSNNP